MRSRISPVDLGIADGAMEKLEAILAEEKESRHSIATGSDKDGRKSHINLSIQQGTCLSELRKCENFGRCHVPCQVQINNDWHNVMINVFQRLNFKTKSFLCSLDYSYMLSTPKEIAFFCKYIFLL